MAHIISRFVDLLVPIENLKQGLSMSKRQRFGCLDIWPCSCKQTLSLRFPIVPELSNYSSLLWLLQKRHFSAFVAKSTPISIILGALLTQFFSNDWPIRTQKVPKEVLLHELKTLTKNIFLLFYFLLPVKKIICTTFKKTIFYGILNSRPFLHCYGQLIQDY